jgi:glycosyltransferase involved in cell wall biosynthesis
MAGVDNIITTYHNAITRDRWSVAYVVDPVVGRLDDISVSVSDGIQDSYRKRLPNNKWQTVYNGIDVEAFGEAVSEADKEQLRTRLGLSSNGNGAVLLSVGRYVPQKRQETLVRAMPAILESHPDTHLVLVGWGPLEETLREIAVEQDVSDSVTVTGRVSDIYSYHALADVFAIASSFEGFGIVAVEAMAARLPVVSSDVLGLNEVIRDGETGYLVPPSDPNAFASAICTILNGDTDHFGRKGRKRAEMRFDISQTVATYDEFYENLT